MRIEDFLSRLKGVTPAGDRKWMACCPAHHDEHPSMSVSEGTGGRILLKCFSGGCTFQQIVQAMGLKESDLMGESTLPPPPPAKKRNKKMVAKYDYRDAAGFLQYQVVRFEPKSFSVRVPAPDSPKKWQYGFTRFKREPILYRLPELLASAKAGKVLFIVEGEKDVNTMTGQGFTATTAPFGANKEWRKAFNESFRGSPLVVIIADKDHGPQEGKAGAFWQGQKKAWRVMQSLKESGIPCIAIVLPDIGDKPVKDATDFFTAGGTADQLRDMVKHPEPWPAEWHFTSAPELGGKAASPRAPLPDNILEVDFLDGMPPVEIDLDEYDTLRGCILEARALDIKNHDEDYKITPGKYRTIMARTVTAWLEHRGHFFYNIDDPGLATNMYFDSVDKVLRLIDGDDFKTWLSYHADVNHSRNDYKYLVAELHNAAMQGPHRHGVRLSEYWEKRGDSVYLSNGEGMMCRISPDSVEMVPNGTDDVLFPPSKVLKPWTLKDGPGVDPFESCSLFSNMACVNSYGKMILKLWMLSVPMCMRCKPPIILYGVIGSGKTRAAIGILEILGQEDRSISVSGDDKGEADFWVSLAAGGILIADNLDSRIKWFSKALEGATTGGTKETRKLYSQDTLRLRAKASLMLTSSNPMFASEPGTSDRLLVVRLDRRIGNTAESSLSREIEKNRDESMTWICRILQKVLADHGEVPPALNRRHPDFSDFSVRAGRAMGCEQEVIQALKDVESDKARFNVENDFLGSLLLSTLTRDTIALPPDGEYICLTDPEWSGTSTDLVRLIKSRSQDLDKKTLDDISPRKVGKRLSKMWPHIEKFFQASSRIKDGRTVYTFRTLAPVSESEPELNPQKDQVGKVGLEGVYKVSHIEKKQRDFIKPYPLNPLNPLEKEETQDEALSENEIPFDGESLEF